MSFHETVVNVTPAENHHVNICDHIMVTNHRDVGEDGLPDPEWSFQTTLFCAVCHQHFIVTVEGE